MNRSTGNIRQLLNEGQAYLRRHDVPNARRNTEWLLGHALSCKTLDLYVDSDRVPSSHLSDVFWSYIERRAGREPLQYIIGTTEFMSLAFDVPRGVFVPRPETEVLVETSETHLPAGRAARVLDLCCGTGIVAVSLACRHREIRVVAVDASAAAVAATRRNAARHGVDGRIECVEMDAVAYSRAGGTGAPFDAVVCNPPYIATADLVELPADVRDHEPIQALDGGEDGLDFYRAVIPHLQPRVTATGFVAFEIGDTQADAVAAMLSDAGFVETRLERDYAGRDRVVVGVCGQQRRGG